MKAVCKASAGAALVLLVALLWAYAGFAGAPALAQDEATPEGQYVTPPAVTTPIPEDQYDAPPGNPEGGGDTTGGDTLGGTTAPVDGGDGDGGEAEAGEPGPRRQAASVIPGYVSDGFLSYAAAFLAVSSLIATVLFFLERRGERLGR